MSNASKSALLGVPYGSACNRLRRQVLFQILKRHNENICYRCGLPIETPRELSMEHKISWQTDVARFWDLSNIAFSHLRCNVIAGRLGKKHSQETKDIIARKMLGNKNSTGNGVKAAAQD